MKHSVGGFSRPRRMSHGFQSSFDDGTTEHWATKFAQDVGAQEIPLPPDEAGASRGWHLDMPRYWIASSPHCLVATSRRRTQDPSSLAALSHGDALWPFPCREPSCCCGFAASLRFCSCLVSRFVCRRMMKFKSACVHWGWGVA